MLSPSLSPKPHTLSLSLSLIRHGFRFNTSEGRIFECAVEGTDAEKECEAWLEVLPSTKATLSE